MKKMTILFCLLVFSLLCIPSMSFAHETTQRQDVIWARNTTEDIVLDGVLNESSWVNAESITLVYGNSNLLPTSGWRAEFQEEAVTDPTHATVKFLAKGNQLYLAFIVPDSSIVGARDWARWDGILMSFKDKGNANRPSPPLEYFYTYWYDGLPNGKAPEPGDKPMFRGTFSDANTLDRTPANIAKWDAFTRIEGSVNDGKPDTGYVVEMRIALDSIGYNPTRPEGDIVLFNFSIWDCDYLDTNTPERVSTTRTHWQSPWGNVDANNAGSIYIRPDITVDTEELPIVPPDVVIPNVINFPDPVIDGSLNDSVWTSAYSFNIAWDDTAVRNSYPGVGPWDSGQFQPDLDNSDATPLPQILDPSRATIKMAVKGNFLYCAADVNDQLVQGSSILDAVDGVRFIFGDRNAKNVENVMLFRPLFVTFGADGKVAPLEYLPAMIDTGGVEYFVKLKGTTTVNNNSDIDEGYVIEMKVDLTKLGYPDGLGDRYLFGGVDLFDGDSFDDPANNYGSRVWWFREHDGGPGVAWMYISDEPVGVNDKQVSIPSSLELFSNYPNPFNPETNIKYSLPSGGNVSILIYNILGQELKNINLGNQPSGSNIYKFNGAGLSSGVYLYKIRFTSQVSDKVVDSKVGKMMYMK